MLSLRVAVLATCLLSLVFSIMPAHLAQDTPDNKKDSESKTLFLVARPELRDPIFRESVVLMFPLSPAVGKDLVVGLILNKSACVNLSGIFSDDEVLRNRSETTYFGGPVDPRTPGVLFRSSELPKRAELLFADVYLSFDPEFISELLKDPKKSSNLRLFLGRSQWAPAQLQNEMDVGAWYSVQAETSLIFSSKPQYLWRKLFERAEPRLVANVLDMLSFGRHVSTSANYSLKAE